MAAYFGNIDVSAQAAYPANPQAGVNSDVSLDFAPDEFAFVNKAVDGVAFFSFDGVNDHGQLDFTGPTTAISYRSIERYVWLRGLVGPSNSVIVQVSAATDR